MRSKRVTVAENAFGESDRGRECVQEEWPLAENAIRKCGRWPNVPVVIIRLFYA